MTWLKNANDEFVLLASDCSDFGGNVPDPAIFETTCNANDFTLTFKAVDATQNNEKWSCSLDTSPTETVSSDVTITIKGKNVVF